MSSFFEEKSEQVVPGAMAAFGIQLLSRYGRARELREMLDFAERTARLGAQRYVISVFYDSQACLCTFELADIVRQGDPVGRALWAAADESIEQFEMFGVIGGLMTAAQG